MDHSIVLKSYGKINLGLDVLRRREDGYHEVRMIMQTVGLYDVLTMKKRKDDKIEMTCNLFVFCQPMNVISFIRL